MVRKIIDFIYKETGTLNQAALLLGFFSIFSQVIGFLRDRFLAHIFGVGTALDTYYSAFRIPDFLFVTVASVVSLSVLIPFIIEKEAVGKEALRNFIDSIFTFFSILIILAATLAFFLMPTFSGVLFKGFSPQELQDVIFISRLMLLSPVLLGFSNLFGSLTQAYNRFTIYALAPVLYNTGIIIGILLFSKNMGVIGVALGVIMGAAMHFLIQVPFVWKLGLMPSIAWRPDWKLIERVAKISFPRTVTLSMSSITFIFLVAMASRMASGSISILSFSWNLETISLSLIGVSYSLAAFPTLSRRFQEKNLTGFIEQMKTSARFIIFWSLPFSALLIILRAQVVRVLLGSGLFDWSATRLTAAALALFVISSVFQSLMLLFMRGFYSAGYTKRPFFINLISTAVLGFSTYGLVEIFYQSANFRYFISALLRVEDLNNSVVLMLPLGFTIGTIFNGIYLWLAFEKEFKGFSRGVMRSVFEGVGASFIMGVVAYVGLNLLAPLFNTDTLPGIFLQGALAGIVAIGVGSVVLIALKNKEFASVLSVLQSKFWKTEVIATDPEIV